MSQDVLCLDYTFHGHVRPPLVGSPDSGVWRKADTSAAGAPTVQATAGLMELALAADNEVENICLFWGDELGLDIDDLLQVDIWAKVTASLPAAVQVAFGVASARNDAIDSIAQQALFRLVGSNSLLVETDDGSNDNDDVATGLTLSTTIRRHTIEFGTGVKSVSGGLSKGGKSSLLFSAENSQGLLRRVAENTQFDMSNYAGGLQLFAQVQKTAAASVATLSLQRFRVKYRQG